MIRSPRDRLLAGIVAAGLLAAAAVVWTPRRVDPEPIAVAGPATTDAASAARSEALSGGTARVELVPAVERSPQVAAPEAIDRSPRLDAEGVGIVLHGDLLDPDGRRLEDRDAGVNLFDEDGESRIVRSPGSGSYSVSGLRPGRYWVSAWAGRAWEVRSVVLDLAAGTTAVRRDLVLEPVKRLSVKVVSPDGVPVRRALEASGIVRYGPLLPVATSEPPGRWFDGVHGSLNNRFAVGSWMPNDQVFLKLDEEYLGALRLHTELPVDVSLVHHHLVLETKPAPAGATEIGFVVDPERIRSQLASVRLTIADAASGEPVDKARASLSLPGQFGMPRELGPDGSLTLEGQAPGEHLLQVFAPDRALLQRRVRVEPSIANELGTFYLEPERPIRGRVVGPDGDGLESDLACVRVDPASGAIERIEGIGWRTKPDGSFSIGQLRAGRYLVRTTHERSSERSDGPCLVSPVVGVEAGAEGVVLSAVPCSFVALSLRVADPTMWKLVVLDGTGRLARETRWYGPAPLRLELPPGAYRARVFDPEGHPRAETAFSAGEAVARVEIVPRGG